MDTLITAKAKLDAGYGLSVMGGRFNNNNPQPVTDNLNFSLSLNTKHSKLNTRSVDPHIWISGENQVPISLVNEDGERITSIPMMFPGDGKGCGFSPNASDPLHFTLEFLNARTGEITDTIRFIPWNPYTSEIMTIIFRKKDQSRNTYVSDDGTFEIAIKEISEVKKQNRVTHLLKFDFKILDVTFPFEFPVIYGIDDTQEIRDSSISMTASNTIYNADDCETLSQEPYICPDSKVFIQIKNTGKKRDHLTAGFRTSYENSAEIICEWKGNGIYRSQPFYVVPSSYGGSSVTVGNAEYPVIKDDVKQKRGLKAWIKNLLTGKELEKKVKKPALLLCMWQYELVPDPSFSSSVWEALNRIMGYHPDQDERNSVRFIKNKLLPELRKLYSVTVDLSPVSSEIIGKTPKHHLGDYDMVFIAAHGGFNENYNDTNDITSSSSYISVHRDTTDYSITNIRKDNIYPDEISACLGNSSVEFVVLASCFSAGTKIYSGEADHDIGERWQAAFKSECFIGFEKASKQAYFLPHFIRIFDDFMKESTKTMKDAVDNVKETWEGPTDSPYNLYIYGDLPK